MRSRHFLRFVMAVAVPVGLTAPVLAQDLSDPYGVEDPSMTPPPPEEPMAPEAPMAPESPEAETNSVEAAPAPEIAPPAPSSAPSFSESYVPEALSPDAPDTRREQAFNEIYLRYNATPTPSEGWEAAAGRRGFEAYKVQKGDTLSGLSQTLFGDPHYWPKIWALNSEQVYNPHEIDTWMNIQFFPGNMSEPPTLAVSPKEEAPKAQAETVVDGVKIPPARVRPVVRTLPPSLPRYKFDAVNVPPPKIEVMPVPFRNPEAVLPLSYYVQEGELRGVGEIRGTELGLQSAGEYQYIHVKVSNSVGQKFKVVREIGRIPEKPAHENAPIARVIEVQGEIQILEEVNPREGIHRAMVTRTIHPITVGSKLVEGSIEQISTMDGDAVSGPSARIVGAQFSSERNIADQLGLVFLSGGRRGGLQEGMILPVLSETRLRVPESLAVTNPRTVGHARVVRVTENFATAVLTRVSDDIRVGDSVGSTSAVSSATDLEFESSSGEDELTELPEDPATEDSSSEGGEDDLTL